MPTSGNTTILLSPAQEKLKQKVSHRLLFGLFMLGQLPMGLLAGLRIRSLTANTCVTSVPYKWLNKNPFRSTYFAVQSMAAELSTAAPCMLAIQGIRPSVAFIIVNIQANFHKKATSKTYFTCNQGHLAFEAVQRAIETGEAHTATLRTEGRMTDGTLVSSFEFTWSFKQRSSTP